MTKVKTESSRRAKARVPLVDLERDQRALRGELEEAFARVLDSGTFVLGGCLREFERSVAAYHSVAHAVGLNSGTDSLFLALKALDIGAGDEVVVPATTFVATANTVLYCGASPKFVEVEADTLNLDPARLREAFTPATKAIMVVHFHGHPANMDALCEIADERGVPIIEDCAQSFGAEYKGRKVGNLGAMGCLSFYPTKPLGAVGDAGMLITDDDGLHATVRSLRNYGETSRYVYDRIGFNSRMDEVQAALLQVKLGHVEDWIARRRRLAARYGELLEGSRVQCPRERDYAKHVYWVYTIRLSGKAERDAVQQHLEAHGVDTHVFYPICVPDQRPYRGPARGAEEFSVSRQAADQMLALPFFVALTDDEQRYVVDLVKEALQSRGRTRSSGGCAG